MLGAFKTFWAERDRVLCWPPKISLMTAAAAWRAVLVAALPSDALENCRQGHAVEDEVYALGGFALEEEEYMGKARSVEFMTRAPTARRWNVLIMPTQAAARTRGYGACATCCKIAAV